MKEDDMQCDGIIRGANCKEGATIKQHCANGTIEHQQSNTTTRIQQTMSTATGKDSQESTAKTKGGAVVHAASALAPPVIETMEEADPSSAPSASMEADPSLAPSASIGIDAMSAGAKAMDDTDDLSMVNANGAAESGTPTNQRGECLTDNKVVQTELKIASNGKNNT